MGTKRARSARPFMMLATMQRLPWTELCLLACATLCGHSFGGIAEQALEHTVRHGPSPPSWPLVLIWVGSGVGLLGCLIELYHRRHRLLRVRAFGETSHSPARVLILAVSPLNTHSVKSELVFSPQDAPGGATLNYHIAGKPHCITLEGGSALSKDIREITAKKFRWSWQQSMRALENQIVGRNGALSRLERVRLLGSSGVGGSAGDLVACRSLLKMYGRGLELPVDFPEGLDFMDFPGLLKAYESIIQDEQCRGTHPHDIVIDVTGGQKTVSIAAVCATLTSDVRIQYVESVERDPDGADARVFVYNVVDQPPPSTAE